MATQDIGEGYRAPAVDRSQSAARGGSIGMVMLVAIALVGAALGLLLVGRGNAGAYILALLAFLAMVGVFSLFALATGILRVPGRDAGGLSAMAPTHIRLSRSRAILPARAAASCDLCVRRFERP